MKEKDIIHKKGLDFYEATDLVQAIYQQANWVSGPEAIERTVKTFYLLSHRESVSSILVCNRDDSELLIERDEKGFFTITWAWSISEWQTLYTKGAS